jgi:hypothetical protein
MDINSTDSIQEANDLLRQYYNKAVPFSVADDAKIVNAENVTATFIIPEGCFPFTGYDVNEFENDYDWHSQISVTLDHIFLRLWIEDNYNIDSRKEFNLVFCPNDPNRKVKEFVRTMGYSGQKILRILLIGQYKYDVRTRGLDLRRFSKSAGVQTELVGRFANPDLMRHDVFIDIRASDVSNYQSLKWFKSIPVDFVQVILEYCDTCREHFMQTDALNIHQIK